VVITFVEASDCSLGISDTLAKERRGGRVAEDLLCLYVPSTDRDNPGIRDC
jgi:hypothetical protein